MCLTWRSVTRIVPGPESAMEPVAVAATASTTTPSRGARSEMRFTSTPLFVLVEGEAGGNHFRIARCRLAPHNPKGPLFRAFCRASRARRRPSDHENGSAEPTRHRVCTARLPDHIQVETLRLRAGPDNAAAHLHPGGSR